jgi:phosphoenolpyruvate-protein phosphotransferase/dihydroxyacetone kinase phosphotransfer subunit
MVGLVVVSHSARLAEGVAQLAREMAGDVRLETAGGHEPPAEGEEAPLGTDAARVMSAIEAADDGSGDGVLVLMDLGSAVLSAEMALELLDPSVGERVRLVPAPLVEGAVAAAVAAQAGQPLDAVAAEARGGLAGKLAHLGEGEGAGAESGRGVGGESARGARDDSEERSIAGPGDQQTTADAAEAVEDRFVVTVAQGLHARPAARFVRTASALDAQIEVTNATTGAGPAPAGSLNAIATLGVREGHEIVVRASGPDARAALQTLRDVATEGGGAAATVEGGGGAGAAGARSGDARGTGAGGAGAGSAGARGAGAGSAGAGGAGAGGGGVAGTGAGGVGAGGAAGAARPLPPDAPRNALVGIASSPGVALAPLRQLAAASAEPPPIAEEPAGTPADEWVALAVARDAVRGEIEQGRERLAREVGPQEAEILDALSLVLDDDALLIPARRAIEDDGASAARAWADAVDAIAERYRALEDPYQRERAADVLDVGRRVLLALAGERPGATRPEATDPTIPARDQPPSDAGATRPDGSELAIRGRDQPPSDAGATQPDGSDPTIPARDQPPSDAGATGPGGSELAILVAHDLTPIDAAGLDRATVAGIATAHGGPTSHGAILARALGVPAVVALGDALLAVADGTPAILDGDAGLLIPAPAADVEHDYRERRALAAAAAEQARAAAHDPAITADGVAVEVAANAGNPRDAEQAATIGADGVGLFRTEFAFLDRATAPSEEEQVAIYTQAARALDGRPLVIRTLDAGADKPLPYLAMPAEANPFLGVRGVRLGLARPELLRTQLRAIVRTAAEHPNVKLMFPMIATIDELRAARALLEEALAQTAAQPREGFEVGIMVEVPAAALTAVQLAHEVDFFSLGTNDLTQYVLAAERGNAALAALADGLHPAVLRLVDEVCRAARAHGRWVGVCGELGADPAAVPLLVGLGVRELSVAAPSVPAVKAAVRALDADDAEALAHAALAAESADAVRTLVGFR